MPGSQSDLSLLELKRALLKVIKIFPMTCPTRQQEYAEEVSEQLMKWVTEELFPLYDIYLQYKAKEPNCEADPVSRTLQPNQPNEPKGE